MDDDEIAALYASGLKIVEIAARGSTYYQVRAALLRKGVELRNRGRAIDREAVLEHYAGSRSAEKTGAALGLSAATVRAYARSAGSLQKRGTPRRYELNEAFFDTYTPESCYWGGFLAADGALVLSRGAYRVQLMLGRKDAGHVERFRRAIGSTHPISVVDTPHSPQERYICVSSRRLWDSLVSKFNVTPRKSFTLQPPPEDMPDLLRWHFARGYFDGDGSIGEDGRQLSVVCGSRPFLEWLRALWGSHHKIGPNARIWNLALSGDVLRAVVPKLYAGSTPDTRLERKRERFIGAGLLVSG